MKTVELYARVRHAVMIEGISERAAADRFGINARTVSKMLKFSVPPGYMRRKPPFRPKLDGFTAGIVIGGGGKASQRAASVNAATYTWGAAAISVTHAGFGNPRRGERSDTLYWFTAERGGNSYRVAVSISSGVIVKVIPA